MKKFKRPKFKRKKFATEEQSIKETEDIAKRTLTPYEGRKKKYKGTPKFKGEMYKG